VQLAELLNEIAPGAFRKKTILANSGAEAVETAVKLARKHTGRGSIVCFEGGYHGRTLLTLSLTSKYALFKSGFGPFAPEIVRLPIPHVYRPPAGMTEEQYVDFGIRQLEHALIAQVDPSAVAAMIIEPVQGEAGFIPVPPRFLRRIRELCDAHGIVMIADEVQCGFGRTGRLFAVEHYGIAPDLLVTAKSLGAGMPISAVTGRADIMDSSHLGGIGGTFGGNPVSCAAALAVLDEVATPGFRERADEVGRVVRARLEAVASRLASIGEVRGLGPMLAVEFAEQTRARALATTTAARERGLVLLSCGVHGNVVRVLPPILVPDEDLERGLAVLEESLVAADRGGG
jgi:4-aminobutyrate aminotransferase/(S)-3-amino-2-methylpropionate transaminase